MFVSKSFFNTELQQIKARGMIELYNHDFATLYKIKDIDNNHQ